VSVQSRYATVNRAVAFRYEVVIRYAYNKNDGFYWSLSHFSGLRDSKYSRFNDVTNFV